MSDRFFLDTNLLVYAYDVSAGSRHRQALAIIAQLSQSGTLVVSTQVLIELAACLRRKVSKPLPVPDIQRIILEVMDAWQIFVNQPESILAALDLELRFQLSFWDALILQAAQSSSSNILYSEDFNHGQLYNGVRVVNPFQV